MKTITSRPHSFTDDRISIDLICHGNSEYTKVSYPVKYGLFSKLETRDHIFEFNLNHEIRHAKSKKKKWLHPSEWLKRTTGNDWIYYSSGGYAGVFEAIGEYYLPNLTYATNSLLGGTPFKEDEILNITEHWHDIISALPVNNLPEPFAQWFDSVCSNSPEKLKKRAETLFEISGSRVSVIPPDARHVDYNIIPVNICDGCLYKCRFCKVKNKKKFAERSHENIERQILQLKKFYGKDIINYNALFIGEHDGLAASGSLILKTMQRACDEFEFDRSVMKHNYAFIFGSVDSFLETGMSFFERLDKLDFLTFINIGIESYDQATLDILGKPLTRKKVKLAFDRAMHVNDRFSRIEITCNFVMDDSLPSSHHEALLSLISKDTGRTRPKGCIYLSPLQFGSPSRKVLYDFYRIKAASRFPTFLYLIQRL